MTKASHKARNGNGSITYDRARRSWVARVTLGTDGDGRQVRRSARRATRAEAKAWLDAELDVLGEQRRRGITPANTPKVSTVAEWLDLWQRVLLPGTVAPRTLESYQALCRLYVIPAVGTVKLTDLTPTDVTRMLRAMAATGKAPSTQRLARAVLRRALHRAEVEGLVLRNVAALADGVRISQPEGRTLTPLQARRLLTEVAGDRFEAAYVVAIATGLRSGELLGLRWDDIDIDARRLTVRGTLKRIDGRLVVESTKTRTSRRTVHLPAPVVDALRERAAIQARERDLAADEWTTDPAHDGLVFTTAFGTPVDGRNFAHYLTAITQRAGLGHWTPHEWRHSAASILLAMKVPLKTISDMLGHSSIKITSDVYGHLLEPAKEEAAAAMHEALFADMRHVTITGGIRMPRPSPAT